MKNSKVILIIGLFLLVLSLVFSQTAQSIDEVKSVTKRNVDSSLDDLPYQAGWPLFDVGQDTDSCPTVIDIDGDGQKEIFLGGGYDGNMYAWHADASVLNGWPKTNLGYVHTSPAVADIDNDGEFEIVVASHSDATPTVGFLLVWNEDGTVQDGDWPKIFMDGATSMRGSPTLADVDGDGDLEIIQAEQGNQRANGKIYVYHHDGQLLDGWPQEMGPGMNGNSGASGTAVVADIDGDDDLEIFLGGLDGHLYGWHHDGSSVAGFPALDENNFRIRASPVIGDLDNDSDLEIVVAPEGTVFIINHDGTIDDGFILGWAWYLASPALADLDGDQDLEIIIPQQIGNPRRVFALHHDGSSVDGWPLEGLSSYTNAIIADFSDDYRPDVLLYYYDYSMGGHVLGIFNATGAALYEEWATPLGIYGGGCSAIADIDADGDTEIVLSTYEDIVFVFDHPGTYLSRYSDWPMYQHDNQHTGRYTILREPIDPRMPSTPVPRIS